MNKRIGLFCFAVLALFAPPFMASATDSAAALDRLEGDYLYRVTKLRAAPGKLADLLGWQALAKTSGYYETSGDDAPFIIRHSQGDQWDLLLFSPMGEWRSYHDKRRSERRKNADEKYRDFLNGRDDLVAFSEDLFARGPDIGGFEREVGNKGLFHVEMFRALAGKRSELYRERRMENEYLAATGQSANMIFSVEAGGDVDVFTIGAHESLETFAAPAPASGEEKEAAAKAAGFKDRADISFYLRSLISAHHDTLAVRTE